MNWCDFVVIGIIGIFAVMGLFKGFIMSVYRLVSFMVCVFLSLLLSLYLAAILEQTAVYSSIKSMIINNLATWSHNALSRPAVLPTGTAGAETILGTMQIPPVFKSSILSNLPSPAELLDFDSVINAIGERLAGMILSVTCLILLYFALRLIFAVFGVLLRNISELPVFKQVNKIGGLILGALQGLLTVYILFAILTLFNLNIAFTPVFEGVRSSMIAARFYEDNIIINFLFPQITS